MSRDTLVIVVALVQAGALLALGLLLGGVPVVRGIARRRRRALVTGAARAVRAAAVGHDVERADAEQLRRLPRAARVELIATLAPALGGEHRARLNQLADDAGLVADGERWCASMRTWRRLRGARLLTLIGGGHAVVPALLDDPAPAVRAQAVTWVAQEGAGDLAERVAALLDDPAPVVRFAAMDALCRLGRPATVAVAQALTRRSGREAEALLRVAAKLSDLTLTDAALGRCADPDPSTRALAAAVAGALGGEPAVEALTRLLGDRHPGPRRAAAQALGRLGHWPAAAPLAGLLGDPDWDVRLAAAAGLRRLGAPGMIMLRRAAAADDAGRDMARQALDIPVESGVARS